MYLLKWNLVCFVISKETKKLSYIIIIVILYKWKFEIFMFLIQYMIIRGNKKWQIGENIRFLTDNNIIKQYNIIKICWIF